MNGRIAVLCPSRGNPAGLKRLAQSVRETASHADVVAYVEEPQRDWYRGEVDDPSIRWSFGDAGNPADKTNRLLSLHPEYSVYGFLPDDTTVMTMGWDRWVINAINSFPNRLGVVSAHHNGGEFVNFAFVSREWIDLLGWMACPDTHNYVWDTVLEMLGEATRIAYAKPDEFDVHHDRPVNDQNTDAFVYDCVQFFGWCIGKRRETVRRIREAMSA